MNSLRLIILLLLVGGTPTAFISANSLSILINEVAWPVKAAYAANGLKMGTVVINEVAWMGTKTSYSDEWIELYNNTDSPINLEGWTLKASDGTPEIQLARTVPANGFYLLKRGGDYRGALNNKGERLELYDNFGNLVDLVDASSGWPTGDNKTKQTMERKNSLLTSEVNNWQTSQDPGGTPGAENSQGAVLPQEEHKTSQRAAVSPLPLEDRPLQEERFPIHIFLIAFLIALFSATIILVLKKKTKGV